MQTPTLQNILLGTDQTDQIYGLPPDDHLPALWASAKAFGMYGRKGIEQHAS